MVFMKEDIEEYISYIKLEKKLSKNTIFNYQLDLINYFSYLEKNNIKSVLDIKLKNINDYLKYLKDTGLNSRTIARHITVIKEFHKYLIRTEKVVEDVTLNLENVKLSKKLPVVINEQDMESILDIDLVNAFKYRDKAMLELMYGSGLRVSELINLDIYSIDFDNDCIIINGKGKKERIVPISKYAKASLLAYLEVRPSLLKKNKDIDSLFLNNHLNYMLALLLLFRLYQLLPIFRLSLFQHIHNYFGLLHHHKCNLQLFFHFYLQIHIFHLFCLQIMYLM